MVRSMYSINMYLIKMYLIFLCLFFNQIVCYDNSPEPFTDLRFLSTENTNSSKGIRCFWLEPKHLSVYDLKGLKRPFGRKYDYNFTLGDDKIIFNFCDNILPSCHSLQSQVTSIKNDQPNECTILSSEQRSTNNWALVNETNPNEGFIIELNSGESCKLDSSKNYTVNYLMKCNKWMSGGEFNLTSKDKFDINSCHNQLEFESSEACEKANFYAIWDFLQSYSYLFGGVLIIVGLFEVFLGAKLLVITIFLTSCFSVITIVFIFLFQFVIPNGANPAIIWVVLGISSISGLILGYFISKNYRFIFGFLLGGYMGYFLGLLLYNVALNKIDANPALVFWSSILITILICCIATYFLVTHIVIIATSFCGAYAFIRGISLYTEGFPNESYIIDLIKNQELDTLRTVLTPVVYAYLAGWILLFIVGVIFQYKTKTEETKVEEDENAKYYLKK